MHRDMAIEIFKLKEFIKKNPDHYQLRQAAKNGFVFRSSTETITKVVRNILPATGENCQEANGNQGKAYRSMVELFQII